MRVEDSGSSGRTETEIEVCFAIIRTPWGYIVAPPEQELTFSEPMSRPRFEVFNLTASEVAVVFEADIAALLERGVTDWRISARDSQVFTFLPGRPPIDSFSFDIQVDGYSFRARADSDPRILIRP